MTPLRPWLDVTPEVVFPCILEAPVMMEAANEKFVKMCRFFVLVTVPFDNLQSSLAVKTPEAEMTSLQMTSLKGFLG